jgi:4-hydroxybenzoate polyprenyltransferase
VTALRQSPDVHAWPLRSRIAGWILATHAFPVAAVTTVTFLLALLSDGDESSPGRALLLAGAMLFGQVSIGLQNDYVDRHRDAAAKPGKPIPAGQVPAERARAVTVAAGTAFLALHAWLGLVALVVGVAAVSAGYAYNLCLKHTRFGGLAYVAGFGLLTLWVWVATEALRPALAWCGVFGAPLLFGVAVGNAAPDIEGDRATGVRNLAAILGWPAAGIVSWGSIATGVALAGFGVLVFESNAQVLAAGLIPTAALLVGGIAASAAGRHWLAFRLQAVLAAVLALAWIIAVRD